MNSTRRSAKARCCAFDELLELTAQTCEISAARLQGLDHRRGVEQREQQVLDGDEFVPLLARALEGVVQTVFELGR